MNNITNQIGFLRNSRTFPEDLHQLTVEVNKAYVDTALVVNNRIISTFSVNKPSRDGENWYFTTQRQEGFREVYRFTSGGAIIADIPLGFTLASISQPTRCWGQYTDGTSFYGIIWASSVAIAGQVTFYLTPDVIRFVVGAGAPTINSGFVVIEWISQV